MERTDCQRVGERQGAAAGGDKSAVRSDNVAKEVVLVSERKGHILPVYLEPTVIPPTLKYQLAGIQHIDYFRMTILV